MRFDILTLFPELVESYLSGSILGRAQESGAITAQAWDIRSYAHDKHATVDDTPYGGGPGMVLKVEPIDAALEDIGTAHESGQRRIVVMGAKGSPFTQEKAQEFSTLDQLILICGRYEGVDQRVIDHLADEELSVGPYVLAGGELPALTVLEATARLIPSVLGNPASLEDETFSQSPNIEGTTTEYPQYTKPATYKNWSVPEVLLTGDHEAIQRWRDEQRT